MPVAIMISHMNSFTIGNWIRGRAVSNLPALSRFSGQKHPVTYYSANNPDRPAFLRAPGPLYLITANREEHFAELDADPPRVSPLVPLANEIEAAIRGKYTNYCH